MPDSFRDRENTFEQMYANDETLRFKAVARRNKALALWAAGQQGLTDAAAESYVEAFVGGQVGRSDGDVATALRGDLARAGVDVSDHRLQKRIGEEMAAALASVKAGK